MASFYKAKLGIFKEVETEVDPNATPGPAENQDETEQPAQQNTQAETEQPQEQQPQDNPEQDKQPPEEDPTEDMIPNDDVSTNGSNNGEDSLQSQNQGTAASQSGAPSHVDGIKKKEEEIYADLTPEELDIKHKELKSQFLVMFDMTTDLIERINNISLNPKDIFIIEHVSNNLSKLRTMLCDYMHSVYKTKSYKENHVNYNRFLATLNGISKILEEINKNED